MDWTMLWKTQHTKNGNFHRDSPALSEKQHFNPEKTAFGISSITCNRGNRRLLALSATSFSVCQLTAQARHNSTSDLLQHSSGDTLSLLLT